MTGELTHIELGAPDARKAKAFFGALLGWTFEPFGDGEQAVIQTPGIRGGLHDGVTTTTLTAYFSVDDIGQAVARVRELGGLAEDPWPEQPGFGRFSTCTDDQGIPFGLHQPIGEWAMSRTSHHRTKLPPGCQQPWRYRPSWLEGDSGPFALRDRMARAAPERRFARYISTPAARPRSGSRMVTWWLKR